MYNQLLILQYVSVIGLFVESWLVFRSWKDSLRAYLFISCVAAFTNNLGYLLELRAKTEDAYITALQLSYAGRVWVTLALFLFICELCNVKISGILVKGLACMHFIVYLVILTLRHHNLYYIDTGFSIEDDFPLFAHQDGIVHHFFMLLQGVYIVLGVTILIMTFSREKKKPIKRRLLSVLLAVTVESLFFIMEAISDVKVYDFTMMGSVLGTVFMYISIFRYNLLGTRDIARDFMVDRLSEGVIAIDNEGDIQYYNEPVKSLFPGLENDPDTVIDQIKQAILHGETIDINDRIFTPEENDLLYKGESFGKLYVMIDSTEHYKRLHKEKKILRKELLTDPLTGFYNRKGMEHYSEEIYQKVLADDGMLFLCVADMNGLKYINDNFGHEQGDKAIRELGMIIRESLRDYDMAFRTGGDEFLIMGKCDDEGYADDFSLNLEELIKKHNESGSHPYPIDMSYGPIVSRLTGKDNELDDLIKISDEKMYKMKKSRDSHRRT